MTAYDQIERQFQRKGEATGTPTGFTDLDDITSGLQPTDLIIRRRAAFDGKNGLCLEHRAPRGDERALASRGFLARNVERPARAAPDLLEAQINSRDLRRGFCRIPTGTASRTRSTTCIRRRFSLTINRHRQLLRCVPKRVVCAPNTGNSA
jgi:replicative DNA helicase